MARAYIGMGSNEGDRMAHLKGGLAALGKAAPRLIVVGTSSVYGSTPVGMTDQPDFLNAVVAVETTLGPYELLDLLNAIERENGRRRLERWGPRTLDMDILTYGDLRQDDPVLTLPHPRLRERRFVLEPLLEIDPDATLPGGSPVRRLLEEIGDDQVTWLAGEL